MANWKVYMNNHFGSCTVLAHARDHCRERDVKICLIPGEADAVGITDGTDAWIAPVSADCFSVNVQRLMEDLRAGRFVRAETYAPRRERKQPITLPAADPPPDGPGGPRRRAEPPAEASTAAVQENAPRRRRHVD